MKDTILDRLFFNQKQQDLEGLGFVVSTDASQQVDAVDGGKAVGNQPARLHHRVLRRRGEGPEVPPRGVEQTWAPDPHLGRLKITSRLNPEAQLAKRVVLMRCKHNQRHG
jgi:hypothetical protein